MSPDGASTALSTRNGSKAASIEKETGVEDLAPEQTDQTTSQIRPGEVDDKENGPVSNAVSVDSISTIPNGGLRAWLVVLGSFFLFFNSWSV